MLIVVQKPSAVEFHLEAAIHLMATVLVLAVALSRFAILDLGESSEENRQRNTSFSSRVLWIIVGVELVNLLDDTSSALFMLLAGFAL